MLIWELIIDNMGNFSLILIDIFNLILKFELYINLDSPSIRFESQSYFTWWRVFLHS